MSKYEAYSGKLKPTGKTLDQTMSEEDFPSNYDRNDKDDVKELFADRYYKTKYILDGMVYDIEKEDLEEGDILQSKKMMTVAMIL